MSIIIRHPTNLSCKEMCLEPFEGKRIAGSHPRSTLTLRWFSYLALFLAAIHAPPGFSSPGPDPEEDAVTAIAFVEGQQESTDLITSYSGDPSNLAHLFDQALALILLSHAGQADSATAEAAGLLADALIGLQELNDKEDRNSNRIEADFYGYWRQAYKSTDASVDDWEIVTGPNAWAAYALLVYAALLDATNGPQAELAALRFARYAIDFRRPVGFDYEFSDLLLNVFSTEHNLDMFWLLNSFDGSITHEAHTLKWWAHELYFNELVDPSRGYWRFSDARWNRGSKLDGTQEDDCKPSDVQSWGSITALYAGDLERQGPPLNYLLDPLNGLHHTELNFTTNLYGTLDLTGIEDSANDGVPSQTIWNEATGHALVALFYAGRDAEGLSLMNSLLASKWEIGGKTGWPHSITQGPIDDCHAHYGPDVEGGGLGLHVGATCWTYFAIKSSQGDSLPYISTDPRYVVWTDFAHIGTQSGNFQLPFNTVIDAVSQLAPSGTVKLKPGSTPETPTISKPLRMEPVDGIVRIGAND